MESTPEKTSWWLRPRILWILVLALLGAAVGELAFLLRARSEMARMVQRLTALQLVSELGLAVEEDFLLTAICEEKVFPVEAMSELRRDAHAWMDDFSRRQNVDEVTAEMLQALMNRHLATTANDRMLRAAGRVTPEEEVARRAHADQWFLGSTRSILPGAVGEVFRAEYQERWPALLARLGP